MLNIAVNRRCHSSHSYKESQWGSSASKLLSDWWKLNHICLILQPIEDATAVIATKKANGEAAHLSCCLIGGEFVLCGGSKNVHMMFRKKGNI